MYPVGSVWLKQNNKTIKFGQKPGVDRCIRWLNPLLLKCGKQLCPV